MNKTQENFNLQWIPEESIEEMKLIYKNRSLLSFEETELSKEKYLFLLEKEKERYQVIREKSLKALSNPKFIESAPVKVQELWKEKVNNAEIQIKEIEQNIKKARS